MGPEPLPKRISATLPKEVGLLRHVIDAQHVRRNYDLRAMVRQQLDLTAEAFARAFAACIEHHGALAPRGG